MCRRILLVRLLTRLHIEIALLSRSDWISFTRGNLNSKNNIFFLSSFQYFVSYSYLGQLNEHRVLVPWSRFLIFLYMRKNLTVIVVIIFDILLCTKFSTNLSFCNSLDRFLGQKHFVYLLFFLGGSSNDCFFYQNKVSSERIFFFSP